MSAVTDRESSRTTVRQGGAELLIRNSTDPRAQKLWVGMQQNIATGAKDTTSSSYQPLCHHGRSRWASGTERNAIGTQLLPDINLPAYGSH
jgi:hypothetical protein